VPAGAAALGAWLTWPAYGVLAATLLFSRVFPDLSARWQFLPFVLGMVFLGLPHGALDHLAPLFLQRRPLTARYLAVFVLGYLALAAVYLAAWQLWPVGALVVFLLLSWLHWGQGDAYYLEAFARQSLPSPSGRLLVWAVRGGLPIILPPLIHPQAFAQVARGILGWYGGSADWLIGGQVRAAGLVVFGLLIIAYGVRAWRTASRTEEGGFRRDTGEVAGLVVFFWLTPPILAVGVYFCVWHSARHLARLALLDPADTEPLAHHRMSRVAWRTAGQALPMTLGALALLAGLFVWRGRSGVGVGGLVYLYLSLIAALTFPHFALVLWMDREERRQHRADAVRVGGRGD